MGVFERPPGSGIWWILYYHHGKRYREKVGPKRLALAAYQQRKTESRQGKFDALAVRPTRLSVRDLVEQYMGHFRALKSPVQHERHCKRWIEAIGDAQASAVEPKHLEGYRRTQLARGLKASTINREMAFLRRCYSLAMRDGLVASNPFDKFSQLQENNARKRFLSEAEEERLMQALGAQLDRDIVMLALHTGLRLGELFGLVVADVDLESGWGVVRATKNGQDHQFALNSVAKEILGRRLSVAKGRFVFGSRSKSRPMDAHNWTTRNFRPALAAAGIEDFTFHDLRHTFCSRLTMAGVPLTTVKEMVNHKTMSTTLRYSHLTPGHIQSAAAVLETATKTTTSPGFISDKT